MPNQASSTTPISESTFDKGVRDVLEAIANITSDSQGRTYTAEYYVDWAIDWVDVAEKLSLRVTVIEHDKIAPFSVLTNIRVVRNAEATERYHRLAREGFDWFGRGRRLF